MSDASTTDKDPLVPMVRNQNLESISSMMSLNCYGVMFLCVISISITGVTLLIPGAIDQQKQIFIGIAALIVACSMLVLACARRNPSALSLWTWLSATLAGFLIGISFMILAPHVTLKP